MFVIQSSRGDFYQEIQPHHRKTREELESEIKYYLDKTGEQYHYDETGIFRNLSGGVIAEIIEE